MQQRSAARLARQFHLFSRAHCFLFRSFSRLHFDYAHYILSPRASGPVISEQAGIKELMKGSWRAKDGQKLERAKNSAGRVREVVPTRKTLAS